MRRSSPSPPHDVICDRPTTDIRPYVRPDRPVRIACTGRHYGRIARGRLHRARSGEGRLVVHLQGLRSDLTYEVRSADVGVIGSAGGDVLMQDGIELVHGDGSLAHVLVLTAQP